MPWTVTVNNKVDQWATGNSDKMLKDAVTAIRAHGPDETVTSRAAKLRHVKKQIFDIELQGNDSNYRIVGESNPRAESFEFKAVYKHARGGGKQLEAGKAVAGY